METNSEEGREEDGPVHDAVIECRCRGEGGGGGGAEAEETGEGDALQLSMVGDHAGWRGGELLLELHRGGEVGGLGSWGGGGGGGGGGSEG